MATVINQSATVIINIFGGAGKAAANNPLAALICGLISIVTAAGVSLFVIPTLVAGTLFLYALAQVLFYVLLISGVFVGGIGGVWASSNALQAAKLNYIAMGEFAEVRDQRQRLATQARIEEKRRKAITASTVFAASPVGQIEAQEVPRS